MKFIDDDVDAALAILTVMFFLLLAFPENAAGAEVAEDKQMHAVVSAMMAGAAAVYLEDKTDHPVAYSIVASMLPGIAKEVYDAAHPKNHTAEVGDLVADLAGATFGAWIGHGICLHSSGIGYKIEF